jgi:tripartite-type tricarboxylate transporter receptor subunit TctC
VVVNKPGGGGSRGWAALSAAKPDGYSIGTVSNSTVIHKYLLKGVPYDWEKNFKLICTFAYAPIAIVVRKGAFGSIQEFIKKAKDNPDSIKIGISGKWTTEDFAYQLLQEEAGIKLRRVDFAGGGERMTALLGGHIDAISAPPSEWKSLYDAGSLDALLICREKRVPSLPQIPTSKELGFNIEQTSMYMMGAPGGTPDPIVNFLSGAFKKGIAEPAFINGAAKIGVTASWISPEESLKIWKRMDQDFQLIIKKFDLKPL